VRKVTKTKGAFTSDVALLKLIYLAVQNIQITDDPDQPLGADIRGTRATGGSKLIQLYTNNIQMAVKEGFNETDILESTLNHEIGHNLGGSMEVLIQWVKDI
jgi:hypothetical protein